MKKGLLFFSVISLFLGINSVKAISFTDKDTMHILKERDSSCVKDINMWIDVDDKGNYVYQTNAGDFYSFTKEGKCVKLSHQDVLDFYNGIYNTYEFITTDENEDYAMYEVTMSTNTNYGFVLTKDIELQNKEYHVFNANNLFTPVEEPKVEDIANYYERLILGYPTKATIDSSLTYYQDAGDGSGKYIEVENPQEENILNYWVVKDDLGFKQKKLMVIENETILKLLEKNTNYAVISNGGTYYYMFEAATGNNVYNMDGKLIAEGINDEFIAYSNGLYGYATDKGWQLYNADNKLLYTFENLLCLLEDYNEDYYGLMAAYNDEHENIFYEHRVYKVTKGENQKYVSKDLEITFSGSYDLFKSVLVNDKELDKKHYTVASGSTIITLKDEYLKTLTEGTYNITVEYTDGGKASTTFQILEKITNVSADIPNSPNTSDNITLYIGIGIISILCIVGLVILKKKDII